MKLYLPKGHLESLTAIESYSLLGTLSHQMVMLNETQHNHQRNEDEHEDDCDYVRAREIRSLIKLESAVSN